MKSAPAAGWESASGWYQRFIVRSMASADNLPAMFDPISAILLAVLVATTVLYWLRVREQVHQRRLRSRLDDVRHLTAVVRASLVQQRS
jgi:hypothetical protein